MSTAKDAFLLVTRALPEPLFLLSRSGAFAAANEAGRAMLRSKGVAEGASLHSLVEDDAVHVEECLRVWARNGTVTAAVLHCAGEEQPCRCEGALFATGEEEEGGPFLLMRYVPRQQAAGRFVALNDRIDALAKEVRLRQQAEVALAASEAQFRGLADSIPTLCWMANPDGWIFWYNQRWYEYTGTTPKQMEGWGWQSVHHPDFLPAVLARWKAAIETGQSFEMVFPLRRADGSYGEFLTRVVPIRDGNGNITRWFGTNTDVSQLKRVEEKLRASQEQLRVSEERLRLTQKAAHIGSWELNLDTEEYVCSQEVYDMLGLDRAAPLTAARLLRLMYFSGDRQNSQEALRVATTKNREFSTQFRIRRADGSARWIAARGKPFFNQGRNVILGVFIDITDTRPAREPDTPKAKAKAKRNGVGRRAG